MTAGSRNKKVKHSLLAFLLLGAIIGVMLIGCSSKRSISKITIFTEKTGDIDINFETAELRCWDTDLVVQLNEEQLTSYREYITEFSKRVFAESEKYTFSYPPGVDRSDTIRIWSLIVTYDNGKERRLDAEKDYPDDWNIFVEKTNALIGYDLLINR